DKILGYSRDQLLLDIVNVHNHIYTRFEQIKNQLFKYLGQLRAKGRIGAIYSDGDTSIEIQSISNDDLFLIADNFDILCAAHSLRTPRIRPDAYNVEALSWAVAIQQNANGHLVGVLDNGVRPIPPLRN